MKLIFTGDVNFRHFDPLEKEIATAMLSDIQPLLNKADYRILNLEAVLADKEKHTPIVKSGPHHGYSPACISFLEAAATDVAILANNHTGDYGPEALVKNLELLRKHNIQYVGAGKNVTDAYQGVLLEKDGLTVALLAVCENEFGMATKDTPGTAGYNPRKLLNAIRREKTRADYVVVAFHGGNEFNPLPSPYTVDRYQMVCDMGADAVIAGHTHCPQVYEVYNGKPIVYSMGNLMFQSGTKRAWNNSWYYGYLAELTFNQKEGTVLKIYPYRFDKTGFIKLFQNEEKEIMLAYLKNLSDIIADEDELLRYYHGWGELYQWYASAPVSTVGQKGKLAGNLNILTCEAHRDLVTENIRVLHEGLEEESKIYAERITVLSQMPL